jgi:hypothetical protein
MVFLGVELRSVGVVLAEGLPDGEAGRATQPTDTSCEPACVFQALYIVEIAAVSQ